MDVYPSRRTVWWTIFVNGCLGIVPVIWAVSAIAHESKFRGWLVASAPVRASTRRYPSGMPFGVPVESDGKTRVPVWGSKEQVLEDVGRYYSAA